VDAVRNDLEDIILDADLLEAVLSTNDPTGKGQRDRIQARGTPAQHMGNPRFRKLSERLEKLKPSMKPGSFTASPS
jgi:type I restriction enzyme, R subunit